MGRYFEKIMIIVFGSFEFLFLYQLDMREIDRFVPPKRNQMELLTLYVTEIQNFSWHYYYL